MEHDTTLIGQVAGRTIYPSTAEPPAPTVMEKILQLIDNAAMHTSEASGTLTMLNDRMFGGAPQPTDANNAKRSDPCGISEAILAKLERLCAAAIQVSDQARALNNRL